MEDGVQKFSEGGDPQGHHGYIELVFRKKLLLKSKIEWYMIPQIFVKSILLYRLWYIMVMLKLIFISFILAWSFCI